MGGELLLVALGGCFMSNLVAAAAARNIPAEELEVRVQGTLASAPPRVEAIDLEVRAPGLAPERRTSSTSWSPSPSAAASCTTPWDPP
jgi:uncharacterized OsmC-like protein